MYKPGMVYTLLFTVTFCLLGASGCFPSQLMTTQERKILEEILSQRVGDAQIEIVKWGQEKIEKFPAVEKGFQVVIPEAKQKYYVFVVSPVGYRAPIHIMVVIDGKKHQVTGIKVMGHDETPGYGDWLGEKWFTDRFKGKSVDKYLKRVILEAEKPNDIIQITGATVSTEAVLNGVNAAMGLYRELVLGEKADPVPLKVEGFITESQ